MAENSRPDESRDVIVHFIREIDVETNSSRDRWHIFIGDEKTASFDDEASAVDRARELAEATGRPAWYLRRSGYPVEPIGLAD